MTFYTSEMITNYYKPRNIANLDANPHASSLCNFATVRVASNFNSWADTHDKQGFCWCLSIADSSVHVEDHKSTAGQIEPQYNIMLLLSHVWLVLDHDFSPGRMLISSYFSSWVVLVPRKDCCHLMTDLAGDIWVSFHVVAGVQGSCMRELVQRHGAFHWKVHCSEIHYSILCKSFYFIHQDYLI